MRRSHNVRGGTYRNFDDETNSQQAYMVSGNNRSGLYGSIASREISDLPMSEDKDPL